MRSSRGGGLLAPPILTAVAIVAMVGGGPAHGQEDAAVAQGKKLYSRYCASCHGVDGTGNGPAASTLEPKPSDLTQIAKRNGGKFPFYETMLLINGRSPVSQNADASLPGLPRAHGSAAMPVWGEVFSREELAKGTSLDLQLRTTGKIMLITEYVQSIQAK